jgi:AcrR family transcriptional regulator
VIYVLIITEWLDMAITGRPREFNREAALEAAMVVFWRKGFAAASMNDLCDAMGIRSPSLYAAFGGKESLYLEAIQHYVRTIGPPVWGKLGEETTARASVEQLLLAGAESLPESETTPSGCMAMLGAVSDEWPTAIAETAKCIRAEMMQMLRTRLSEGVSGGELPASTDVDTLSRVFLGVFQGMAIQARDGASVVQLRDMARAAMFAWPGQPR